MKLKRTKLMLNLLVFGVACWFRLADLIDASQWVTVALAVGVGYGVTHAATDVTAIIKTAKNNGH